MKVVDGRISLTVNEARKLRGFLLHAAQKHDRDYSRALENLRKLDLPRREARKRERRIFDGFMKKLGRVATFRSNLLAKITEATRDD